MRRVRVVGARAPVGINECPRKVQVVTSLHGSVVAAAAHAAHVSGGKVGVVIEVAAPGGQKGVRGAGVP